MEKKIDVTAMGELLIDFAKNASREMTFLRHARVERPAMCLPC